MEVNARRVMSFVLILTLLWISEADSSIKNHTIGTDKPPLIHGSNDSEDMSSFQEHTTDSITNSSKSLMWDGVNHLLEKGTKSVIDALNLADVISAANISDECERSLKIFLDEFSQWKSWAVQMADANAKLPSGILEGRVMSLGSFDQCLRIRFETADHRTAFRGRYCLVRYTTPLLKDIYAEDKYEARNEEYAKTYGQPPEWIYRAIMFFVMAAVLSIYVMFGKYLSFGKQELVITYHAIHRTAWALSLGLLTYSLHYGHAVTVNRFLSWSGFAILSNFTYLGYLFHRVIINAMEGSMREPTRYSELDMILECVKIIFMTLVLSFIAYIAVEMPFTTIGNIILKK